MKKKMLLVILAMVFVMAAPVYADRAVFNLYFSGDGAGSSGTTAFHILSTSTPRPFGLEKASGTGVNDYVISGISRLTGKCYSIRVSDTSGADGTATFDLGYKVSDTNSTSAWSKARLIRIVKNSDLSSGTSLWIRNFQPPDGDYLRFYFTQSGTTSFTSATVKMTISNEGNCREPEYIVLSSQTLGLVASGVSSFTVPDDAVMLVASLMISGNTIAYRVDGTDPTASSGMAHMGSLDPLVIKGYQAIKAFEAMPVASGVTLHGIFYGKP